MKELLIKLKSSTALIAIIAAFIWSVIAIASNRVQEAPPGSVVVRIGHWQLEPGFREGLKEIITEYEKIHPNVRVVVDSIPESTYGQWVTTQLMGGTAPDLIEVGLGLPRPIWISYYIRYFTPLTTYAGQPNPYNKGTDLEGVPLRETFKDGLLGGYVEEVQEVMQLPICQHSVRLYYNKTLLKKLTGLDQAPEEYREFLEMCKKIASQKDATGRGYLAIAGSSYSLGMWEGRLFDALTYPLMKKADFNRDGRVAADELYVGFQSGVCDLDFEGFQARMRMLWEVTRYFPFGYVGLKRDEAVFRFIQQQAVFIPTGTWDAGGLRMQAEGQFELGVVGFPTPKKDDPVYGKFVFGPLFDTANTSCTFAVNRNSKHADQAIDFLLFLTSQKMNEKFNKRVSWIPCIVGAKTEEFMKQFEPKLEGIYPATQSFIYFGSNSLVRWLQDYSNFQATRRGETPEEGFEAAYEVLKKDYGKDFMINGKKDFEESLRDSRRGATRNEQVLSAVRAAALFGDPNKAENAWIKYRGFVQTRQLTTDVHNAIRTALAEKRLRPEAPYAYTPEAEERIRKSLAPAAPVPNP